LHKHSVRHTGGGRYPESPSDNLNSAKASLHARISAPTAAKASTVAKAMVDEMADKPLRPE